jgi:DNA invertase Pin-like site-specific DNA recombinase
MPKEETQFEFNGKLVSMKRAVLYMRVSTGDQNPETQALDLRRLAEQRGFEIVHEYTDRISGAKAKRPALDAMLAAAHRREFDTASDRLARSVRHFLEVLDTLNHLGIEFVSFRENLDTGGPLGRAVVVIVSAVAELERNLIIERVRAGLRRARLEGRALGRKPIEIDRPALLRDRTRGLSLSQLAKAYKISRTSVARALKQSEDVMPASAGHAKVICDPAGSLPYDPERTKTEDR